MLIARILQWTSRARSAVVPKRLNSLLRQKARSDKAFTHIDGLDPKEYHVVYKINEVGLRLVGTAIFLNICFIPLALMPGPAPEKDPYERDIESIADVFEPDVPGESRWKMPKARLDTPDSAKAAFGGSQTKEMVNESGSEQIAEGEVQDELTSTEVTEKEKTEEKNYIKYILSFFGRKKMDRTVTSTHEIIISVALVVMSATIYSLLKMNPVRIYYNRGAGHFVFVHKHPIPLKKGTQTIVEAGTAVPSRWKFPNTSIPNLRFLQHLDQSYVQDSECYNLLYGYVLGARTKSSVPLKSRR